MHPISLDRFPPQLYTALRIYGQDIIISVIRQISRLHEKSSLTSPVFDGRLGIKASWTLRDEL